MLDKAQKVEHIKMRHEVRTIRQFTNDYPS